MLLAGGLLAQTAGCGAKSVDTTAGQRQESTAAEAGGASANGADGPESGDPGSNGQESGAPGFGGEGAADQAGDSAERGGLAAEYDEDDLNAEWTEEEAVVITCSGTDAEVSGQGAESAGGILRITQAGTYVLRDDFEGQIQIEAGKEDLVRLVLEGFTGYCEDTSPIYAIQCGKLVLTLAEGSENQLSDGSAYVFSSEEEDEPDAVIFSKDDLTINGTGSLAVNGNYSNGIRSKDDLKIISGTIQVTAVKDGIKGKDSLTVKDGQLQITSGQDGLKSNNDSDPEKGYLIIDGGQIQINAGDDAIHSETWLTIHDGEITIEESYEGIEGMKVDINGGTISVISSDDGINAAAAASSETEETDSREAERQKMEANPDVYVQIAGGQITINAGADGIDSNGNLYVTGGTTYINGPENRGEGALDYNGSAYISGGFFAAVGSSGMMQTFSADSEQQMLMVYYEEAQAAGTAISLTDEEGNELFSWVPEKTYECLLLSMPELTDGMTCTLTTGENSQEAAIDGVITQLGEGRGFGGRGGMGGNPGGGGGRPGDGGGFGGGPGRNGENENTGDSVQGDNAQGGGKQNPPAGKPGGERGKGGPGSGGGVRPGGADGEGVQPPEGEMPPEGET